MKLHAGEIVAGRYEIEATIGSGGMSVVYRAYDNKLDRYVTLKVLKEEYLTDKDLTSRFPQEARAAAALNHPNIVSIFDFGQDGDICYIVLEYIDGSSLKELIAKSAPFDDDIILDATIQIAKGLSEAHRSGIVHRDIKPQNILVTRTSIVKVTDFGVARVATNGTLTAGSGSMGSVHYSSPEQARNGYLDHTTDIYSLGVTMFEMATGRTPFDGETEVSVAMCHINNKFPDILDYNPSVSDSILRIIDKATEKSSSLRYQTADDLIADLQRAQSDDTGDFVTDEVPYVAPPPAQDRNKTARDERAKARSEFLDNVDPDTSPYNDYDYDDSLPKSDKAAVWGGILLGLIFVAILFILGLIFIIPRFTGDNERVFAPSVVGMSLAQAEAAAAERGLLIFTIEYEYSDAVPDGYVIRQLQTPMSTGLSAGDAIQVVMSLGEDPDAVEYSYHMPDLVGYTLASAQAQLSFLSIETQIEREYNDHVEHNIVISQTPSAGTPLREGSLVILRVSIMPDTGLVTVPVLFGQTEAMVLDMLAEAMLLPGTRTTAYSTTYAAGIVMMQDPMPGELVYSETTISYIVSLGLAPNIAEAPPTTTDPPQEEPHEELPSTDEEPHEGEPVEEDLPEPPPQIHQSTFIIPTWSIADNIDTVRIQVRRQTNDTVTAVVFDEYIAVNQLPMQFTVSGYSMATYHVFSIEDGGTLEVWRTSHEVNFNE